MNRHKFKAGDRVLIDQMTYGQVFSGGDDTIAIRKNTLATILGSGYGNNVQIISYAGIRWIKVHLDNILVGGDDSLYIWESKIKPKNIITNRG